MIGLSNGFEGGGQEPNTGDVLKETLKFKPKNSTLTDEEWQLAVYGWGLAGAIARDFKEWRIVHKIEGETFGEFQADYKKKFPPGDDFKKWWGQFSDYVLKNLDSCPIDKLGSFGEWLKGSGLKDKVPVKDIVKEFLAI